MMIATFIQALPILIFIARRLSKADNRKAVMRQFNEAVKDGKITIIEWSTLGKAIGVFKDEQ